MKSNRVTSLGHFWSTVVIIAATALQGHSQTDPSATARKALDLLLAAHYPEFQQLLTDEAKDKLTIEFLQSRVNPEINGFGDLKEVGKPLTERSGNRQLFSFPVRFSKTTVNVQLTVTETGQVAGLYFRDAADPLPPTWHRPPYSKPELFRDREITIGSDEWKLPGTLTIPVGKGPFPAVVLVHGAGPNDRDESIFAVKVFADIAEGLASRGIAVLRYEKRTKTYAPQMSSMSYTLHEETIEDAVRALSFLAAQPEVNPKRVFVLGHSLGGYSIPRIAQQYGKLAGAIVLAGNARRIEDVSVAQVEAVLNAKGGPTPDDQKRLDLMKSEAARVKNLKDGKETSPILLGLPTPYFLDLVNYDPVAEARKLGIPMLFLQGERDFQVTMEDYGLWKNGLVNTPNVTFRSYPGLNHLFFAGEGPPSPTEYRKAANVSVAVIDDISGWITGLKH